MKIPVGRNVLDENDRRAQENLRRLQRSGLVGVNVLASPGAGKTTLLLRLLDILPAHLTAAVIEGDVASSIDTKKIRARGFPATQINTDGGCHLTAEMVARGLDALDAAGPGVIFIENIGNLICPAGFWLGESLRLVMADVAEGDDKPVKYPAAFRDADVVAVNKIDLYEHMDFSREAFAAGLRAVNPDCPLLEVSARTGEGVDRLAAWVLAVAGFAGKS